MAIDWPMPRVPPVTSAVLPESEKRLMMYTVSVCFLRAGRMPTIYGAAAASRGPPRSPRIEQVGVYNTSLFHDFG